ncbi:hypothetical protein MANY_45490 [Mycolicibacterium anyangense]|uniref:Uncharacterized protein n=1 Tax=Mycolicibacterium anyangense TaxID=1431246 RepID=A0A6N4WH21_9MYCO|nr:hypothetical protein MANY_45490 [Mycolicibacterium anyangense]
MAIPVQLQATDFSSPDSPEPTKKKDAQAKNSTQTGSFHTVAVMSVDTMPSTPTLTASEEIFDICESLSASVLVVMTVVMISVSE